MIPGLLAAFLCFGLFLLAIIALFQARPSVHRFGAMALTWLILLAAYIPIYFFFQHSLPPHIAAFAPLHTARGAVNFLNGGIVFTFMYLTFSALYTSDHGLSLAFMFELEGTPGRSMTLEALKLRFPYDAMLRGRLGELVENNFVIQEGDYYRLAPKGILVVAGLGGLKTFLRLDPGG